MKETNNFIENFIENLKVDVKLEVTRLSDYLLILNKAEGDILDNVILNASQRKIKMKAKTKPFVTESPLLSYTFDYSNKDEREEVDEFDKNSSYLIVTNGKKILILDESISKLKILFFKDKNGNVQQIRLDYPCSFRIENVIEIRRELQKTKILQELNEIFN